MPSQKSITHYSKYFRLHTPSTKALLLIFVIIGAATGAASSLIIHYRQASSLYFQSAIMGITAGIIAISLPAIISVGFLKIFRRNLIFRHAMFAMALALFFYSIMMLVNAALFALFSNVVLSFAILLASNACLYFYWFLIERIVLGRKKSAVVFAATHPILNIIFYIPMSAYLFTGQASLSLMLIKLIAGMTVFLLAGYLFLYLVDRPAKKFLGASGLAVMSGMLSQWLFNITYDVQVIGMKAGIKRDANVDILMLKGKEGLKGVFVNPDIHYGPFASTGGAVATESIGKMIVNNYSAAPFVVHSTVDLEDNPLNTGQVYRLSKEIKSKIDAAQSGNFEPAKGHLSFGKKEMCRATNIKIGNTNLITLSKAPFVTEDINRSAGNELRGAASKHGENVILIDAHNSRFESASPEERKEIKPGSKYVAYYEQAIKNATSGKPDKQIKFGSFYGNLNKLLGGEHPDIGNGYFSVGLFKFGREAFCMVYFDSNNMLPRFRKEILEHITNRYKIEAELYTTDTHSINSLSFDVSNALGRHTKSNTVIPVLDTAIETALKNAEQVSYSYKKLAMTNFGFWGSDVKKLIEKTGRDIRRTVLKLFPFVILAAFIIASWIVSVA